MHVCKYVCITPYPPTHSFGQPTHSTGAGPNLAADHAAVAAAVYRDDNIIIITIVVVVVDVVVDDDDEEDVVLTDIRADHDATMNPQAAARDRHRRIIVIIIVVININIKNYPPMRRCTASPSAVNLSPRAEVLQLAVARLVCIILAITLLI